MVLVHVVVVTKVITKTFPDHKVDRTHQVTLRLPMEGKQYNFNVS